MSSERMKKALETITKKMREDSSFMDEYFKEQEQIKKENKEFFSSVRFKEIINLIKQIVGETGAIGDNLYQEPLFANVSNQEFIRCFSCVMDKEISGLSQEECCDDFYQTSVKYDGLTFLEIHGQGTAFIVQGPKFSKGK